MTAPSGISVAVPIELVEGGTCYKCAPTLLCLTTNLQETCLLVANDIHQSINARAHSLKVLTYTPCGPCRAVVNWAETGVQTVLVSLNGAPVAGSPLKVLVHAAPLSAQHCVVTGLDGAGSTLSPPATGNPTRTLD